MSKVLVLNIVTPAAEAHIRADFRVDSDEMYRLVIAHLYQAFIKKTAPGRSEEMPFCLLLPATNMNLWMVEVNIPTQPVCFYIGLMDTELAEGQAILQRFGEMFEAERKVVRFEDEKRKYIQ